MDDTGIKNAAYINSQCTCAIIEAMSMQAENMSRFHSGQAMAYTEKDFKDMMNQYEIGTNSVIERLWRN